MHTRSTPQHQHEHLQQQNHKMILPSPSPSPRMLQSKTAHARRKKTHHLEEDATSTSKQHLNHKQHLFHQSSGSRRALQHVENTIHGSNTHLCSSSSASIEAPSGCLRFLLSHCSSSSSSATTTTSSSKTPLNRNCPTPTTAHIISKTPKSARISRLPHSKPFHFMKENSSSKPISNKPRPVKNKSQSSKNPTSKTPAFLDSKNTAPVIESLSVSQHSLKLPEESEELQFTPVVFRMIATSSALDYPVAGNGNGNHENRLIEDDKSNASSSNTKTPPLQASFSPEIHSTAAIATTPACYGAGHLLSGVTDKRKCKARGLLAVPLSGPGDNYMLSDNSNNADCEEDYGTGLDNKFCASMLPSPAEASMHWLLSPCRENEEDGNNENSASLHGLLEHKTLPSPSSPLSNPDFSFDWCNSGNNTSDATNSSIGKSQRSTNNMVISTQDYAHVSSSPDATPYSRAVPLKEQEKHCCNIDGGNSPLSADTLGSENVMQTPKSDSSLERPVGLSCSGAKDNKRHHLDSELLSLAGDLRMASLSPKSHLSIWDTTGSSFKFDRMSTPSNSMDPSQFQKILDDQSLWPLNSTFEDVPKSQMRISWREGLVSRIFEMDEFDSCRCLSDEEEDLNVNSSASVPSKCCQSLESNVPSLTNTCESTDFRDGDESKEKLCSPLQCSYAESISTDGGGLAHSTDSDWNLCYKNNLFEL